MERYANEKTKVHEAGFTLLEIIISLCLLSSLLLALYSVFFPILKSTANIEADLERLKRLSRFLDTFMMEGRSVYFNASNNRTLFEGNIRFSGGRDSTSLAFTAFRFSSYGFTGDLRGIKYYVQVGPEGHALYKEMWDPYALEKGVSMKVSVLEGIEGLDFSFYNCKEWTKVWNASIEHRLPCAMKLTVSMLSRGSVRDYSAISRIMVR